MTNARQNNFHEFHYQVRWRTHSGHPGHHPSTVAGGGFEFQGHAPLLSHPDPRNLDIHASLHDPFGQFFVRTFRQRSTIPVYVLADLSASMGFEGYCRKMNLLAEFAASAAYSAYRTGDRFGFIGCDEDIDWNFHLPSRWYKGVELEFFERLGQFRPQGYNAAGLNNSAQYLGKQRSLLFLVSDFHFPLPEIEEILDTLNRHDIVPIILSDSSEFDGLPRRGFVRLEDPESGQTRSLLMRARLHAKLRKAQKKRRGDLIHLFTTRGCEPFFIRDRFDPDAISRYFFHR